MILLLDFLTRLFRREVKAEYRVSEKSIVEAQPEAIYYCTCGTCRTQFRVVGRALLNGTAGCPRGCGRWEAKR